MCNIASNRFLRLCNKPQTDANHNKTKPAPNSNAPRASIQTGALTGSYCAGTALSVPFTASNFAAGNVFTAQLSDAAGSFASPVNIGTLAGLASGTFKLWETPDADLEAMMRTNVEGVVKTIRAGLPHVRKAGWGHVFFIGSTAGHQPYEGGSVYCASKFGVKAMAQSLRLEVNGEQIRVTSVDPGMAETEFSNVRMKDDAKAKALYQGVKPLTAFDVAECVRWCLMLPDHVNIDEILVKCLDQASVHKVHRHV